MKVKTALKGTGMYEKAKVLRELREAEAAILASIKTHEEKLAQWRESAPTQFAEWVRSFDASTAPYRGSLDQFLPPHLNPACQDWRIQNLNRATLRIDAMAADNFGVISLRGDDPIWEYVGLAACL